MFQPIAGFRFTNQRTFQPIRELEWPIRGHFRKWEAYGDQSEDVSANERLRVTTQRSWSLNSQELLTLQRPRISPWEQWRSEIIIGDNCHQLNMWLIRAKIQVIPANQQCVSYLCIPKTSWLFRGLGYHHERLDTIVTNQLNIWLIRAKIKVFPPNQHPDILTPKSSWLLNGPGYHHETWKQWRSEINEPIIN